MFIVGAIGHYFPPLLSDLDCSAKTMLSQDATKCRELLALKIAEKFPWDKQQAESKEFFRQFQKHVAADQRQEVAAMMMYPLRITYYTDPKAADYRFLNSTAELLDVYEKVFHKSIKEYIANYDANEVWGNDYFLQTGSGQIGINCETLGDCPTCNFEFKVKIIRSNSIYRDTVEDIFGNPKKPIETP